MALSPRAADDTQPYTSVVAIVIHWSNDRRSVSSVSHLCDGFREYNFRVISIDEQSIGLRQDMSKVEQRQAAETYFEQLFTNCKTNDPNLVDDRQLLIFAYCGHAAPRGKWSYDEQIMHQQTYTKEHVIGARFVTFTVAVYIHFVLTCLFSDGIFDTAMEIDLTINQQYLRCCYPYDTLCVFESCYGAHDGMEGAYDMKAEEATTAQHAMWTLSAGDGKSYVTEGPLDFFRRLVSNLRKYRGATTVLDRYLKIRGMRFGKVQKSTQW